MKRHDPEASAARFLEGAMRPRARRRFDAHVLDCEDCWKEVRLGRAGRALAESARELAPQALRERVRGVVSLLPTPRLARRRRLLTGVAVAVAVVSVTVIAQTARPQQPELIEALVAHFERAPAGRSAPAVLPDRLGDLRLVHAEALVVRGVAVGAHRYRDPAGHQVVVYRAARTFPMAADARRRGELWEATARGVVLLCADRPAPSLVAGDDRAEVHLVARLLGLS